MSGLAEWLARFEPASLEDLEASAPLQRRHDAKFLVDVTDLGELLDVLVGRMRVLEVAGLRSTPYRTTYFDTPDLSCFRSHVQRRRRRYKVRTRTYADDLTMLELKIKSLRGLTVKHRWHHPDPDPAVLGEAARALVAAEVQTSYGWTLPTELLPSLQTEFRRTTLADLELGERVTIDLSLSVGSDGVRHALDPGVAVVECKTTHLHGPVLVAMARLGHYPAEISKYGVGITLLRSDRRGNEWLPALRRLQPVANATSC